MVWFTADTHFFEDINTMKYYGRRFRSVAEQNATIIDNINEMVSVEDTLWHIGDVFKGSNDQGSEVLSKIKCKDKYLVRGNYDTDERLPVLTQYFNRVFDADATIEIDNQSIYMNHYPINCPETKFSITGHIHEKWKIKKEMINVGVDANHFFPLSFTDIMFYKNAMDNHYDDNVFTA